MYFHPRLEAEAASYLVFPTFLNRQIMQHKVAQKKKLSPPSLLDASPMG